MLDVRDTDRRRWADVAVILAGLVLWGLAIWPPPFVDQPEVGGQLTVWQVYAIAGGMTIAGLLLGQSWRWSLPARLLLLGAAAVLALGLFTTFRDLGPAAVLTVLVPGLLILLATPFFGPMPRAIEGRR